MNFLSLIGRDLDLFTYDLANQNARLAEIVTNSRFLVIGGSGSIGQAVTREIFKLNEKGHEPSRVELKIVQLEPWLEPAWLGLICLCNLESFYILFGFR